ncbi:MAG: hypothetical protein LBM74_07075 [Oscillospiraceae bacterium]|jgi:predicted PhzF superfamily epimerase YddE/YHI9|nr:hypothetical protein [Oscillospiraceae bacterium]
MKSYTYRKADAFTSAQSEGNPAACIWLDENETLTDEEMKKSLHSIRGLSQKSSFVKKRWNRMRLLIILLHGYRR